MPLQFCHCLADRVGTPGDVMPCETDEEVSTSTMGSPIKQDMALHWTLKTVGPSTGILTEGSVSSVSWMLELMQVQARFPASRPLQAARSSALLRCCRKYLHASRYLLRACWRAAPLLRPMHMVALVMAQPVHIATRSGIFGKSKVANRPSFQLSWSPI